MIKQIYEEIYVNMDSMKKILVFICFFIIHPVLASGIYKELDLLNNSEPQANKLLYEFVLKDLNMSSNQAKELANININSVKAIEIDLNDDRTKEIIGVIYSTMYWGTEGYSLFILQKLAGKYKNIAYLINFEPQKKVSVLDEKTNGYRNIKLLGSSEYKFKPFTLKFKNGRYVNILQMHYWWHLFL